ncbi:bca4c640-3fa1-4efc-86af-bd86a3b553f6 [Sclerotinia trifoliorum]|uniref:Bca4c640-3fa1-4efc-86af-bd86a3b553f6 n=1 Tax=Sclerotinia trifoliorum TaxID=28548 RepID=A0A8H2VLZ3_9HELO|nr:bca4c640-3fa1-4efc-86af-bd86a3b553f6 [Sclerotinia trifoliorum]
MHYLSHVPQIILRDTPQISKHLFHLSSHTYNLPIIIPSLNYHNVTQSKKEMSETSKASKFTRADTELMKAIIEEVSRKEISKMVDWEAIGRQLGGLRVAAVHKRRSRLNIKMRNGVVDDEADDSDEFKTEDGEGDKDSNDQKMSTTNTSGGKVVAKEAGGGKVVTKESDNGKAAAKKGNRKAPVKVKAITSKGNSGKVKATWDTVKAEVAADAAAKKKAEGDVDDDDD